MSIINCILAAATKKDTANKQAKTTSAANKPTNETDPVIEGGVPVATANAASKQAPAEEGKKDGGAPASSVAASGKAVGAENSAVASKKQVSAAGEPKLKSAGGETGAKA